MKKQLLQIKDEIDTAKSEINKLEGKHASLLEQLKDQFGCKTIKEADKMMVDLTSKIEELETQIEEGTTELQEKI